MPRVDLKIASTDNASNKRTTTISYVNPEATTNQITTFIGLIQDMTTNTINTVSKVTTETIDLSPTPTKTLPTISWGIDEADLTTNNSMTATWTELKETETGITFRITGDVDEGETATDIFTASAETTMTGLTFTRDDSETFEQLFIEFASETAQSGTITITLEGQNGYISETRTLTITEGE